MESHTQLDADGFLFIVRGLQDLNRLQVVAVT
jgi:hypothetical protein